MRPGRRRAGYAPGVIVATRLRLWCLPVVVLVLVVGALAGCGDDDQDEDQPDEGTFCWLAVLNEPVAEADAPVLRRLDELAPDQIDPAVVVLREAAEELEDLEPGSPERIAREFEIRFQEDYIEARNEVEAFVDSECEEYRSTGRDGSEGGSGEEAGDDGDERGKVRPVDP